MARNRIALAAVLTLLVSGTYLASAGATPGSTGALAPAASPPVSGVLAGSEQQRPTKASQDGAELKTKGATTVSTFELTYPAGSWSGWHSHPGIVIVVVTSGSVTRLTGCTSQTFSEGQASTEVGPHNVSNTGNAPAVLSITRVYPTSATVSRIDQPAPTCR